MVGDEYVDEGIYCWFYVFGFDGDVVVYDVFLFDGGDVEGYLGCCGWMD